MTPVTETYSQIGNVHRAIATWRSNRLLRPRDSVMIASGRTAAARTTCVMRMTEVDDADRTPAVERPRADVRVVDDVRGEEERRHRARADHHRAVLPDAAAANQRVADDEQHAGRGVERRVQGGEIG